MKKLFITSLSALLLVLSPAGTPLTFGQDTTTSKPSQTLYLKDGSVVKGQLTGVEGDSYVIQTGNMGTIKVRTTDLQSMTTGSSAPAGNTISTSLSDLQPKPQLSSPQVEQVKNQMMADPAIMGLVQELLNDPNVKSALSDPATLSDLFSMDPQRIQNNPAVQKLVDHPKMKEILERLGKNSPR